jgi:hypothetical protein
MAKKASLKDKAKKLKHSEKFWEEEAKEPAHQDIFKKSKKPKKGK